MVNQNSNINSKVSERSELLRSLSKLLPDFAKLQNYVDYRCIEAVTVVFPLDQKFDFTSVSLGSPSLVFSWICVDDSNLFVRVALRKEVKK